jgi:hypothetical protein
MSEPESHTLSIKDLRFIVYWRLLYVSERKRCCRHLQWWMRKQGVGVWRQPAAACQSVPARLVCASFKDTYHVKNAILCLAAFNSSGRFHLYSDCRQLATAATAACARSGDHGDMHIVPHHFINSTNLPYNDSNKVLPS